MSKRKAGRPRLDLTPEQKEQVEKLAAVLTQEQIADFLGISERTLRNRITDDPEIAAAYARGRARAIGNVAKGLLQQAIEGNVRAMEFYLRTQAGWEETTVAKHIGADGGALEVIVRETVVDPRNRIAKAMNGSNGNGRA